MTTFVYFIEASEVGRIKIGIADLPEMRLVDMQTGSPCELRLAGVIEFPTRESAIEVESLFHILFDPVRFAGEWFSVTAEQIFRSWHAVVALANLGIASMVLKNSDGIEQPTKVAFTFPNAPKKSYAVQHLLDTPEHMGDEWDGRRLEREILGPDGSRINYHTWNDSKAVVLSMQHSTNGHTNERLPDNG